MLEKIRKFENMHIALWLLKDTCWVLNFRLCGMIMIVPTITVAIFITWKMRQYRAELFHNLAVCLWILANSVWMTGEFFFNDETRHIATVFFIAGLLCILYFYLGTIIKRKTQP
jgi:hypothetical protein